MPMPLSLISEPASSFTPLFRLLDDFDSYQNANNNHQHHHHHGGIMKSFQPKFDVKEVADAYELHGELPGTDQKDVEIEFTDNQTIHIKGRTERSFTSGTPPAGFVEAPKAKEAITNTSHKVTVEEEGAEATATPSSEVTKAQEKPKEPKSTYWVSERSVGEFSRSFTFPARVDQDAVRASMKNGILSIIIPKVKKLESRKITIN